MTSHDAKLLGRPFEMFYSLYLKIGTTSITVHFGGYDPFFSYFVENERCNDAVCGLVSALKMRFPILSAISFSRTAFFCKVNAFEIRLSMCDFARRPLEVLKRD